MKTNIKSISLIFFVMLTSCSLQKNENSSTSSKLTTYQSIAVDCDEKKSLIIDTTFLGTIKFKITAKCRESVSFIDTIESSKDTFVIRNWKDIELVIKSTTFNNPVVVNKQTFSNSLAPDLKVNGFMGHPYQIDFNTQDSSVTFKTLITRADSDVGDIYILKIGKEGKTCVIGTEEIEFGY